MRLRSGSEDRPSGRTTALTTPWPAPVLVGALGGSGTRVVTRLLQHAGIFMGSDLNGAGDSEPVMGFYQKWLRRYLECGAILTAVERDTAQADLALALEHHRAGLDGGNQAWGVKVPRNILMLPFWHEMFPKPRFVHVIRSGLDMAYSKDRNQLRMVGDLILNQDELGLPDPLRAIAYWQRVNLLGADYGETKLGSRYLRLRFEDLCARPSQTDDRLRRFVGSFPSPASSAFIKREVVPPASLGRWRQHPHSETDRLREHAKEGLHRFGYDVQT